MAQGARTQQAADRSSRVDSTKGRQLLSASPGSTPLILQRAYADPSSLTATDVLHLQRTIGNRSTTGIVSKQTGLQAKLKLGPAGDQYEQEADRMAQQVVRRMERPQPVRPQPVQRRDDEEEVAQAKPFSAANGYCQHKTEPPAKIVFTRPSASKAEKPSAALIQREGKDKPRRTTWTAGDSGLSKGKMKVGWNIGKRKSPKSKGNGEDSPRRRSSLVFEKDDLSEIEIDDSPLLEDQSVVTEKPIAPEMEYDEKSEFYQFQTKYNSVFAKFDAISTNVTTQLNDFAHMAEGYKIENYTDEVLGNQTVIKLLQNINSIVSTGDNQYARQTPHLIADLLLFASLHPVQINEYTQRRGKKKTKYKRLSANVINVPRLVEILIDINQQLIQKKDVTQGETLAGIDLNDKDSISQRMLKLSLTNIQQSAREELANDPLFQETLKNPEILKTMLASGSAIEQQFLNTCAAIAITQELQENVSHLAGLLLAGRGVVRHIQAQIANEENDEGTAKTLKRRERLFGRKTIKDTAERRVKAANKEFDEIQVQAMSIMQKQPVNVAALQALVRRWSRMMQKLSVLTNLAEGKKNVPVLSKKAIDEKWNASAVLSVAGFLWVDRPFRRHAGIDQESYRTALMSKTKLTRTGLAQPGQNLDEELGEDAEERKQKLDLFWQSLFASGGTDFSVPGHSLYIQAVKRGGTKLFMIGDPLVDKHAFYTVAEMDKYVANVKKKEMLVHDASLKGSVKPQLIRDQVPFYLIKTNIGKVNPESTLEEEDTDSTDQGKLVYYLPLNTTVGPVTLNKVNLFEKDGQEYIRIIIVPTGVPGLEDGKERSGWVSANNVIF